MKYYELKHPAVRRSIASIESYKPSRLMLGKQAAAMSVEIVGPEIGAENANEVTELAGFITQNIRGDSWLAYRWSLPAGVEMVQGSPRGSLQDLPLGQPYLMKILVRGFTKEKQKLISLSSLIQKSGTELAATAVIVSRPEDTMENRVMDINARLDAEKENAENN